MKFTQTGNAIYEKKISQDLSTMKHIFFSSLPDEPIAIFLTGGFGRSEGAIYKKGNQLTPYNDYDVVLVTKSPLKKRKLIDLQNLLANKLGLRFFDIINYNKNDLSIPRLTIFNYDLQQSYLLHGNSAILKHVHALALQTLPLSEFRNLLRNRLVTYFDSFSFTYFADKPSSEKRLLALYQASKVFFSCVDYHLYSKGAYTTTYRQKTKAFLGSVTDPLLRSLVNQSLQIKLFLKFSGSSFQDYWLRVGDFYRETLLQAFHASNMDDLRKKFQLMKYFSLSKSKRKKASLDSALMHLLFSVSALETAPLDMEDLRIKLVRQWFEYFHPIDNEAKIV